MNPLVPKRPCPSGDHFAAPRVSPSSLAMDRVLEALLSVRDPAVSFDLSLERLVDSRVLDLEKDRLIEAAVDAGVALLEAAKRSARRRATQHNSSSWPLASDLTIKVLSMLDTQSLCQAAATCSMFNNCATDPLCYANIDLTTVVPKVNNAVVSKMIQRAGKCLQSLKLGIHPCPTSTTDISQPVSNYTRNSMDASSSSLNERRPRQGMDSPVLTRSCLLALTADGGTAGALLRRLHLYNIDKMDNSALCAALSACQFLMDLEVVGLHVELRRTLDAIGTNCHSIERICFESSETGRDDSLNSPTCISLVNGCPNLVSLSLRGFKLHDQKVRILVKGFHNLKLVDFSTSYSITGTFLRNLGNGTYASSLEVLILRDCLHLKEVEVSKFLSSVLAGDCRLLRYLDISNKDGLSSDNDWNYRCYSPCTFTILEVLKERPEICLHAKYPPEGSFVDVDSINDSDTSGTNSDVMFNLAFGSYWANLSESSYASDQGSGNEDVHDINLSFDDLDSFEELEFS